MARYHQALQQIETWIADKQALTEAHIRKLHAVLYRGKRARPTSYRDGQNVIRDAIGRLIYLPLKAPDLPALMTGLVDWINQSWERLPIPIIAGMAHYQFVAIHPF